MITTHRYLLGCVFILVLLGSAGCVSAPEIEKHQFTERYYTYSILLAPEKLGNSPQLDLSLALLRMEYPEDQVEALHNMLYGQTNVDVYRDMVLSEQRKNYRDKAADMLVKSDPLNFNWRYAEKFRIKQIHELGIVIERVLETPFGAANPGKITQYYNIEIIEHEYKLLTLDDFFEDFHENAQCRDIVYAELRKYSKLESAQPLSQGIYYNNQPELTFNFFITDDGLGLNWDPAQIAPHSHGSIQIILPWHILSPLMLHSGSAILAKYDIDLSHSEE